MLKKVLIFLLKLVLTGSCLAWALSQVDLSHSVFTRPGAVDYRWMAAGVVMAGLTVVLTSLRFAVLSHLFLHSPPLPKHRFPEICMEFRMTGC